jgi:hypothetical protein
MSLSASLSATKPLSVCSSLINSKASRIKGVNRIYHLTHASLNVFEQNVFEQARSTQKTVSQISTDTKPSVKTPSNNFLTSYQSYIVAMAAQHSNLDRIPKAFMTPSAFINGLPRVSCSDLPVNKNDRTCSICLQEYMVGREGEVALKLPCGHLFGARCLLTFFTSQARDTDSLMSSCPMCRSQLSQFSLYGSTKTENCALFLMYVARHSRGRGAVLDRLSQNFLAVEQATRELVTFPGWCEGLNGGLSTLDYLYIHHLRCITMLNPGDLESSWNIEDLQVRIEKLVIEYEKAHSDRHSPKAPRYGRKPKIENVIAVYRRGNSEELDLEEGEMWESHDLPGHGPLVIPSWVSAEFERDLESVPPSQIIDEFRSRRFARAVMRGKLIGSHLLDLAATQVNNGSKILDEYIQDKAFRESPPQWKYHWQLNSASDTLEFSADYY